jgi:hypothetical protein
MPTFKSTRDIIKTPWDDEVWENKWTDSNIPYLPPTKTWDYKRELKIEDVDIWEQIYYGGGGLGLYAAWCPFAEFYLITHHLVLYRQDPWETFYGPGAEAKAYYRAKELGMPITLRNQWIEEPDLRFKQSIPESKIIYFDKKFK